MTEPETPYRPERFSCRIYGVLKRGGKVLLTRSRFRDREIGRAHV